MSRASGSDGYVTPAVLLTAVLLAAVVSSLVAVSRPAIGLVRIGADEVRAEGLLEGGLQTAAYYLFDLQREAVDLSGFSVRRPTGEIRVDVVDEGGRVDINAAEGGLLAGLFTVVGGTSMEPDAFADRIVDWRDQDDDVEENGAEAAEYEDEQLPYRPTNRPFRSVEEMRFLLGLSAADFRRLQPFVTVHTHQEGVDPLSASPTVLKAIPGVGRSIVESILDARRKGLDREEIVDLVEDGASFLSSTKSGVYRVSVQARLPDGYTDAIAAVLVQPQPEDGVAYRVAEWSRATPAGSR